MHFSLHIDKRRGVDHVQKGPPTRLIRPLRRHGPVSFASLTLTLFNMLYMAAPNIFHTLLKYRRPIGCQHVTVEQLEFTSFT